MHVSGALRCNENVAGVWFDFNKAGSGKARLGKAKTEVKSTAACTQGEAKGGT